MLGSVNQLAMTVGLLLSFVMGVLCTWRWVAFVGAIPSALLLVLMLSMPETPRWFLGKNRVSEALRALLWLRGSDADIEEECVAIEETLGKSNLPSVFMIFTMFIGKGLFFNVIKFSVLSMGNYEFPIKV